MRSVILLFMVLATGLQCTSSTTLSEDQMSKLDPALQWLVEHEGDTDGPFQYETSTRDDSTRLYSVIIHSEDPEALREAGLPLSSVFGEIATARLSLEQIKQAARLDQVTSIQNSEQDPLPEPPGERPS